MFNLLRKPCLTVLCVLLLGFGGQEACFPVLSAEPEEDVKAKPKGEAVMRIAACQAKRRSIDWRLKEPADVLAAVDKSLDELEKIVNRAGDAGCDVLTLPEDTLGLLDWSGINEAAAKEVLPKAVKRMLDRLGRAAAKHHMYLIVCSDLVTDDGKTYNTAFFLGRDGKEIGRYHKVCPTWGECASRERGKSFPVFPTADLGTVGMLICYDLVFPETARCLALQGADIIFFPTMGGAAIGDDDIGVQALRVRAAENHVYLVVAHRGHGAMIISPRGKIIARAEGADGLAIADIDPRGGREGGDSSNTQKDMRARLFRERNPEAFKILTEPNPPVLAKVPIDITREEAGRIFARMLTVGEEEFNRAAALARAGEIKEAIAAFEKLRAEYRGSWIDRIAQERLKLLRVEQKKLPSENTGEKLGKRIEDPVKPAPKEGLASLYPGDTGIERDPRVIFAESFEHDSLDTLAQRWETVSGRDTMALSNDRPPNSSGKQSLLIDRTKGAAGQLYRRLKNPKGEGGWGYDRVFARYYVKFDPDCGEIHHFGTTIGGNHPSTPWPMVSAGTRPDGAKSFWSGIEPFGAAWTWDFYTYWCEMRGSPPRGQTWGNSFIREPTLKVEKGKWICIEQMIKLNDVGDTNGEQALWIDGKQVSHLGKGFPKGVWIFDKFNPGKGGTGVRWNDAKGEREDIRVPKEGAAFDGFRWRTARELNVNYVWLYVYTTKPDGHRIKVWFDDVVLATEYIGPLAGRKP
jgi:predicted amidohydrolase